MELSFSGKMTNISLFSALPEINDMPIWLNSPISDLKLKAVDYDIELRILSSMPGLNSFSIMFSILMVALMAAAF